MALRMRKRPSISAIFESDEIGDRKYTTFAIRCHGILEYSISLNEGYPENKQNPQFTDWAVTGWLVENKKFYDDYKHLSKRKTTKRNKIAARVGDVKESLDDLVSLDLVENMGPRSASRGNTITHSYRFTEQGYLLAWIIKSFDDKNRQKASDKIYSIFQYNFGVNASSLDIFFYNLFIKFKNLDFFDYLFVEQLRKKLESNQNIENIRQLLANFLFGILDFDNDTNKSGRYWELWEQTSNGLRPDGKYYLFLHDVKLLLEKGMYMRSTNQGEYEKQRFENRKKSTKVILEGHCSNCNHIRYIDIYIPSYLYWSNFFFSHSYLNSNFSSHKKCEQCKEYDILVPHTHDLVLYIVSQDIVLGLDIIFEKKDREFTEDANIYQDILRYCIFVLKNNNDLSFDYWNLGYWLVDNNKKYLSLSKTAKNRQETVENIQRSVKNKLGNLEKLRLIRKIGTRPQRKGKGEVDVYKYTDLGCLIAWIIASFDSAMCEEANAKIYQIIETINNNKIDNKSPSPDIFIAAFFKKCKDNGVFGEIVHLFRKILCSDIPIKTIYDLYSHTMTLDFESQERIKYFNDLWDRTMNELDPAVQQIFLYYLKLDIEEKMAMRVGYFKGFEEMRYRIKENPDMIALEARCFKCELYHSIGLDILEYRDKILHANGKPLTLTGCRCNEDNSIIVPIIK